MKLAIVGPGRMGQEVARLAEDEGHEVVATLGRDSELSVVALADAHAAIEFTLPEAAPDVLVQLAATRVPVVSGTTGWSQHLDRVRRAVDSHGSALLHAPNFSLGVAVFRRWVAVAARALGGLPGYDVALHEVHHTGKLDAPSGTARLLAETILEATDEKDRWALFPADGSEGDALDPRVLRVSAARVGQVPGTHEVVFDGPDDQVFLRHTARNRRGFARGALEAARWLQGRQGVFTLDDLLDDRLGVLHPQEAEAPPTPPSEAP